MLPQDSEDLLVTQDLRDTLVMQVLPGLQDVKARRVP